MCIRDRFLITPYYFAGSIIIYIMCTKDWFVVVRSEGIELFQVGMELRSDIPEVNFCININYSTGLFRHCLLYTSRSRKSSAFHGSATTRKRVKFCLFVSMPSSNTFIPYRSAAYLEPVSYTHLNIRNALLLQLLLVELLEGTATFNLLLGTFSSNRNFVYFMHFPGNGIDVYKRQVFYQSGEE